MKDIMKFSENKFLSLKEDQQIRTVIKFIKKIDITSFKSEDGKNLLLEFYKTINFLIKHNQKIIENFDFDDSIIRNILQKNFIEIIQNITYRDFLKSVLPFVHKFGRAQSDADFLSSLPDGLERKKRVTLPVYLILNNLRSAFNVGSIIRTAECMGVKKLFFCGYTPTPKNKSVKKTAMGTETHIEWEQTENINHLINELKASGVEIAALESSTKAVQLDKMDFRNNIAIILGNEALGISPDIIQKADKIICINMHGWKNSLNVAVATGICLYEIQRQF